MFTPDQIAAMSNRYISHYDGYTGEGDIHLDFDGDNKNFAMEGSEAKQFIITVGNTAVASRTMRIHAGCLMADAVNSPGQMTDGAFNDIAGAAGLTGSSSVSGKSIELLKKWLLYNPTRVVGLKIQSDVSTQMQQAITINRLNPFVQDKSIIIYPGNNQNQNVFQDKILFFNAEFQFGRNFDILYPIVATSNLTLTFFFGATLNDDLYLASKAAIAQANIGVMGRGEVLESAKHINQAQKFLGV